ncbi:helix-turn-helix domain-containing protein [Saccharothrix sp. 6-C]|uniref:AraC family transcriptional regulator with amidase-like domain n=1 Tax=Saccharothrix texasensis TaxID=103734 RepID=A0A3N1HD83_9PSEU|nr:MULTISPECIES: helix-turn-helix domain-containing protein [Saccharothrix]QQQ75407.1 helix-turn-helix domain-containing protein [Saccharothrix sp. 6-C]ROP40470.1 AraC family transcriptional regulator with amidase-like domain [Saccharothrix texasensis]
MRTVGVLLLPGSRMFDVSVVSEVWGVDRSDAGVGPFELRLCAPGRVATAVAPVGVIPATHGLSGLRDCDLVVVPGRVDPLAPVPDAAVRALRSFSGTVAALCSGAFTVAAAGMLDGREATTHWRLLDALETAAPRARVVRDVLFTDGEVLTSAGVVGGLDLCLHLVRRAHGADVAAALARRLVMPPTREGGQRQYVDPPLPSRPDRVGIASTVDWTVDRLASTVGVSDMAAHAGMSERTFHRAFLAATGDTPGRWLQVQRVRLARRLLETTDLPVHRVAERAGLGTPANLRRRLRAELGVTPDAYRRTFRVPAAS